MTDPTHPYATKNGYVLEHRVIMENILSRLLDPTEVVHHKNKNKKDNRPENLELMSASGHAKIHAEEMKKSMVELRCPSCSKIFVRAKNQTHIVKKNSRCTCCSAVCRGKFYRQIQLYGVTHKVDRAISENIVKVFTI